MTAEQQIQETQHNKAIELSLVARFLTAAILFYRKVLSPLKPACCRFTPTCSAYALEAIRVHGAFYGSWLAFKRILRCQPFGGSGYDPVPPLKENARPLLKSRRTISAVLFTLFVAIVFFALFDTCYDTSVFEENPPVQSLQVPPAITDSAPILQDNSMVQKKINAPTRFLVWLIKGYQDNISRFIPGKCRYTPSCSAYGIEALKRFGALKGSWLTIKRILSCNPWGGSGHDPVPSPEIATQVK